MTTTDKKKSKRKRMATWETEQICKRYWSECGECKVVKEGTKTTDKTEKEEVNK